ncbi:MAG: DUF4003 family protein [Tissierellia bacterium]|nr:DUF4003 family protein [Tissierellia bacterium]
MNDKIDQIMELFIFNMKEMKGKFTWQNMIMKRFAALVFASKGLELDLDLLTQNRERIKERTGGFSYFRGNTMMGMMAMMSLSDSPVSLLDDTVQVYDELKEAKFWASDYLVMTSLLIAMNTSAQERDAVIDRTHQFFEGLKPKHRFSMGQNNMIYTGLLGLCDIHVESGLRRVEDLYEYLKPAFSNVFLSGGSVLALAQLLAIGDNYLRQAERSIALSDSFREHKQRMDRQFSLPMLGMLATLPVENRAVAEEVNRVFEVLRNRKGFGSWSIGKDELLILSGSLVYYGILEEAEMADVDPMHLTSMITLLFAQQTGIAVAAAAAASS